MSVELPAYFTPHVVSVRERRDGGGMGPGYALARTIPAFVIDEQKSVATASGVEVISTSQVHTNADERIPVGSLVTIWQGTALAREAAVLAVTRGVHPTLPGFQTLLLE